MATKAATSTPPSPLPSTASTLWGRLLGHDQSKTTTAQPPLHAQLTPQDKAGTSTRILLHDTHARLEIFSERANSIFSGIEASRREMVRVREEVESAREKELDTIAQLINRCQSSLQRTIGEPAQAREAVMMQASLTVTTERLHALDEKINTKLDALTVLLQAQNQMTQCLQEQFSRTQTQQSRIIELLAPLHPILQSVPLHINIARNAILEKMPECCPCPCTDNCSSRSTAPSNRTSPQKKGDPPVEVRKRRRIDLESQHLRATNDSSVGRYQGQLEGGRIPHDSVLKSGEIPTRSRPQSTATFCAVQTPSGGKSGIDAVTRNYLRNAKPWSGNAVLATRLSTMSRGKENFHIPSRVPAAAVNGKRFIFFNDDDDDDDDDKL